MSLLGVTARTCCHLTEFCVLVKAFMHRLHSAYGCSGLFPMEILEETAEVINLCSSLTNKASSPMPSGG